MEKFNEKTQLNNRIMNIERVIKTQPNSNSITFLINTIQENQSIVSKDKIFYSGLRKKYANDIQHFKENQHNEVKKLI